MQITLTLPSFVESWANTQEDVETAILDVLMRHVEATEHPFNRAWRTLKQRIPTLPMEMEFTAKQMVGRDVWDAMERRDRVKLGIRVRDNRAELKLVATNATGEEGRYRRLPSDTVPGNEERRDPPARDDGPRDDRPRNDDDRR